MVDDVPCVVVHGGPAPRRLGGRPVPRASRSTRSATGRSAGRCAFFKGLKLDGDEKHIAGDLVREVRDRLQFLVDVGLDYLTLARGTPTLSGGESQRIRLASQIGSGLTGVLYVLDEPTIGLHPRDNARLLERPPAPPRPGQHAGPGRARPRGDRGGRPPDRLRPRLGRTAAARSPPPGPPAKVKKAKDVAHRQVPQRSAPAIPIPTNRRTGRRPGHRRSAGPGSTTSRTSTRRSRSAWSRSITGVSGSGKSSLVEDILWKAAAQEAPPGPGDARRPRRDRGAGAGRQGHQRRPGPARQHADLDPRHLLGRVRPDPRAVRQAARGEGPRLHPAPVQLQPARRPVRGVRGGRAEADRDALPARRLGHLRRLPRGTVHPRDARREVPRARRSPTSST